MEDIATATYTFERLVEGWSVYIDEPLFSSL